MALFQLLLLVSFGMEAGGTLHYKLDAIGMVLPISEMGRLSKIRLSKILHEVDSESLVTKSASAKVLNVGPGRLKWCFTSCTGTMSRCWQYLFDIHIINGQLDMDELRSRIPRKEYHLTPNKRHKGRRNNLLIPVSSRSSILMVVLIFMRTIISYALVWWCLRKTYATAYDRVIGVVIVGIIMTVLSRVPHASRIRQSNLRVCKFHLLGNVNQQFECSEARWNSVAVFSSFSYGGRSSLDYVMPFSYCGNTTPREWYLTSTNIRRHVYPTSMRAEFFCLSHPFQQQPSKCALHVFAECVLLSLFAYPLRSTCDFNKSDNTTDEEGHFFTVRPTCSIFNDLEQLTRLAIWSSPRLARLCSVDFIMPNLSHILVIFTSEETFPEKGGTSLIENIHQSGTWNQASPTIFILHTHLEFLSHNQESHNLFDSAKKMFNRPDSIIGCFESTTYMNTLFPLPDRSEKPEFTPPYKNISICSYHELYPTPVSPAMNGNIITANVCYPEFSQLICWENDTWVLRSVPSLFGTTPALMALSSIKQYRCQASEGWTRYEYLNGSREILVDALMRDYEQTSNIIIISETNTSLNDFSGSNNGAYVSTMKPYAIVENGKLTRVNTSSAAVVVRRFQTGVNVTLSVALTNGDDGINALGAPCRAWEITLMSSSGTHNEGTVTGTEHWETTAWYLENDGKMVGDKKSPYEEGWRMERVEGIHSSLENSAGSQGQPTSDGSDVITVPARAYEIRAWHGCDENNVVRERVYPAIGVIWSTLFWGSSCVSVTGSKRNVSACDNDVSRWRNGETDRNVIEGDRGQAWAVGTGANMLTSWQHKETQTKAVEDVAAPAPPPEPPPLPPK